MSDPLSTPWEPKVGDAVWLVAGASVDKVVVLDIEQDIEDDGVFYLVHIPDNPLWGQVPCALAELARTETSALRRTVDRQRANTESAWRRWMQETRALSHLESRLRTALGDGATP